ncbi:ArdC family protein [Hymenobacter endophyticus]|uniref:Zincin-like metallopeptidase domain-containing protein n=1 Tax=Hymenobacter endophyticus TaxID=3076335 RepID=A0ABU3TLK3_9BACT|nr:zincin-like metallopeptidase domain-containing protein [Hymenobacter endophyticus]MDU0372075.1 zincin-like metallopeptidase domain-containing protein [Hymenobacter endophyticus]
MSKKPATAPAATTAKRNVYEVVTNLIIDQLEKGVVAWKQPWSQGANGIWPSNYATKREYSGFNAFYLNLVAAGRPALYLTYNQAKALGGQVRRGEKGHLITFFRPAERTKPAAEGQPQPEGKKKEQRGTLQYFTVFHYSQIDGIDFELPQPREEAQVPTIEQAEALVDAYTTKPAIRFMQQRAYYSPGLDYVNMPTRESFTNSGTYYSTLYHELVHSTGHQKRLNRDGIVNWVGFGAENYAKEELIAEMGASFLCGMAGIDPGIMAHNAAYIANWLQALRNDNKLVIQAASQAEKAVRFMLAPEVAESDEDQEQTSSEAGE